MPNTVLHLIKTNCIKLMWVNDIRLKETSKKGRTSLRVYASKTDRVQQGVMLNIYSF